MTTVRPIFGEVCHQLASICPDQYFTKYKMLGFTCSKNTEGSQN